jgi:hypothetical protein
MAEQMGRFGLLEHSISQTFVLGLLRQYEVIFPAPESSIIVKIFSTESIQEYVRLF